MSISGRKETKLIVIGETGSGKSSLGNFILKKKVNKFKVGDSAGSVTQETSGVYGEGDRSDLFVIDTPGFNDPNGKEKENDNVKQMVKYIQSQSGIKAIVICLDINNPRLLNSIKTMIHIIHDIFPLYEFWEHVCVVWTKCYYYTPQSVIDRMTESKKKDFKKDLLKLAEETTGDSNFVLPMYFVDSCPHELVDNSRSENEIISMLSWVRTLSSFKIKEVKNIKFHNTYVETKQETKVVELKHDYMELSITKLQREKRVGYDGSITYTDWVEVKKKTKNEKIPKNLVGASKEDLQRLKTEIGDRKFEAVVGGVLSRDKLL
ncbi:AIG1 family protein, putative [Entamoeba histolytica]